ncbi:TPA: hypothetical protein ACWXSG_005175 [Escherichia coli]
MHLLNALEQLQGSAWNSENKPR